MTALVPNVTGADVAQACGRATDATFATGLGQIAADLSREAASAYTRGVGFKDDDTTPSGLRGVILLRALRLANNYQQLSSQTTDGVGLNYGPGAQGFTTQEITLLDEYRRTACSI